MKTTIETLDFPSDIKKKLKMKVSTSNLDIKFLSGHIIKFNKTNLSVREPHKIIVSNSNSTKCFDLYKDTENKIKKYKKIESELKEKSDRIKKAFIDDLLEPTTLVSELKDIETKLELTKEKLEELEQFWNTIYQ